MKFLADEGVDRPIVAVLRELGHDVLFIAETHPGVNVRLYLPSPIRKVAS